MKGTRFVYPERTITSIHIRNFNEAAAPPLRAQALILFKSMAHLARNFLVLFRAPRNLTEEFKTKKGGFFREKL